MRRHTTDVMITAALSHLDPAPRTELTEAELERADAAFDRIVATPVDEVVPAEPDRPRRNRLWVTAGLAGAAGVAVPVLLLGGGNAYGSWTPTPEPLTDADADAAGATCRAALAVPDRGERVVLAERRGEWTYVLLAGPQAEAICLMPNDLLGNGEDPGDREGFFGSYDPDASAPLTPGPGRIDESSAMSNTTDDGEVFWVEGHVGSGVTGVTVHTSSVPDFEASVVDGRFAAWWPAVPQSSDNPEGETWSYTVHLADGSTRRAG